MGDNRISNAREPPSSDGAEFGIFPLWPSLCKAVFPPSAARIYKGEPTAFAYYGIAASNTAILAGSFARIPREGHRVLGD